MRYLLVSLFFVLFSTGNLFSQSLDWAIKPKFKGYDEVTIQNQVLNFVVVKKDGMYGVVSPKNKEILPVKYEKIQMVTEEHFSAFHEKNDKGKVNSFFDKKGVQLDYDKDIQAVSTKKREAQKAEKLAAVKSCMIDIWPGLDIREIRENREQVVLATGDTLFTEAILMNADCVAGKYLIYQNLEEYGKVMIDRDRKVWLKEKKIDVKPNDQGHTIIGWKLLVDEQGEIHFEGAHKVEGIWKTDYYQVFQTKEEVYVYDKDLNKIFDNPHKYVSVRKTDENAVVLGFTDEETRIYNEATKETETVNFKLKKLNGIQENLMSFKVDELTGIYDVMTNEVVIEPKYRYLTKLGNKYFVGYQERNTKETRGKHIERTIFNMDGEVVYNGTNRGVSYLSQNYFKINTTDSTHVIIDDNNTEKFAFNSKERKLSFSNSWVREKKDGQSMTYPLENFLSGDTSVSFDKIPKVIKENKGYRSMLQVVQNGKIGFIDSNGKKIHPCELDEVGNMKDYSSDYKGYFMAMKDGKWGVLTRPKG